MDNKLKEQIIRIYLYLLVLTSIIIIMAFMIQLGKKLQLKKQKADYLLEIMNYKSSQIRTLKIYKYSKYDNNFILSLNDDENINDFLSHLKLSRIWELNHPFDIISFTIEIENNEGKIYKFRCGITNENITHIYTEYSYYINDSISEWFKNNVYQYLKPK